MELKTICEKFGIGYTAHDVFTAGHINDTNVVSDSDGNKYVVQKINKEVFKKPEELMENIIGVTLFLAEKLKTPRFQGKSKYLRFLSADDGNYFVIDEKGDYWRCYAFVDNSFSMMRPEKEGDFYESAYAFGVFQQLLCDYPSDKLFETIPDFHNTPKRLQALKDAFEKDSVGRAEGVKEEYLFYTSRESDASVLTDALERGELGLKVTHNDTKISNVLFDNDTRRGICVIDLDTIMPGLLVNDFGDSIRYGASTGDEDEKDLSKVSISPALFEEYTKGFIDGTEGSLTENEKKYLLWGAKTMTLECGMRFLTDYLSGDTYFKTDYPEHNLVRSRTHIKLVSDMENKWEELENIVKKY